MIVFPSKWAVYHSGSSADTDILQQFKEKFDLRTHWQFDSMGIYFFDEENGIQFDDERDYFDFWIDGYSILSVNYIYSIINIKQDPSTKVSNFAKFMNKIEGK